MTLILTANTSESIWMLADTRLSARGRRPREDGMKVMCLETTDGTAILGYAGLGATAAGTQPANWMSAVLRGRNLPMEQSLGILADALRRQFPRHLRSLPRAVPAAHNLLAQCFIDGKPKLFSIDLGLSEDRRTHAFRYTRHVVGDVTDPSARTPRLGVAGSGAPGLLSDKRWMRELLRLLRAYDRGAVTGLQVADTLAALNYKVHMSLSDESVGPRCVVVWRNRRGSPHKTGGAHQFFDGRTREHNSPGIPTIAIGMDALAVQTLALKNMAELMRGKTREQFASIDFSKVHEGIDKLPDKPDENLR